MYTDSVPPASHFYPRSPCGERQRIENPVQIEIVISIHALLAESDNILVHHLLMEAIFLSTLSLRRATRDSLGEQRDAVFLSTLSLRRATAP